MTAGTGEVVHELLAGRMLPARIHTVLVTRSPVDVQAVSVLQAYASGVFAVGDHGRQTIFRYDDAFWGPPGVAAAARARLAAGDVYDYADLDRIGKAVERANDQWRDYLRALAAPTRHVSYDDLAGDLVSCANTILADLAVPGLDPAYRPTLLVQRGAATTTMLHRYRADVALAAGQTRIRE
jgi:LPS sulfotransferase NodH